GKGGRERPPKKSSARLKFGKNASRHEKNSHHHHSIGGYDWVARLGLSRPEETRRDAGSTQTCAPSVDRRRNARLLCRRGRRRVSLAHSSESAGNPFNFSAIVRPVPDRNVLQSVFTGRHRRRHN